MNKYIVVCILAILLIACEENFCTQHVRIYTATNRLQLDFCYKIHTDVLTDSIFLCKNKFGIMYIDKSQCRHAGIWGAHFDNTDFINEISIELYNLTDTSSYQLNYSIVETDADYTFTQHTELQVLPQEACKWCITDSLALTINESLLPIFTKDYSMLEQFSEYYQEKRY